MGDLRARIDSHAFCRYADDSNIYVRSLRAGERVLASITRFLEKRLRLKINQDKSGVDRPWKRKFLGYSMTNNKEPRLKVSPESIRRFKSKMRIMFRRGPWWNAGASHMNLAMPKKVFDGYGLVSLQSRLQHLQCAT